MSGPETAGALTEAAWFQWAAAVAAIGAAFAVVHRWIVKPTRQLVREVGDFLEDWRGRPDRPGVKGHPGAMTRLAQLENNGGTSVKDTVERTARDVAVLKDHFAEHLSDASRDRQAGAQVEAELREAIKNLSESMPIVARSTPAEGDQHESAH